MQKLIFSLFFVFAAVQLTFASNDGQDYHGGCDIHYDHEFDAGGTAIHHIGDANVFSVGPFNIPLPCILYVKGEGFHFFSSGKFDIGHHGDGHKAYNRFVLDGGTVKRVADPSFPSGGVNVHGFRHEKEGKEFRTYVCYDDQLYFAEAKSTADFGMFGGGITSFYDFSLTKNVVTMFLVTLLLMWVFLTVAKSYTERKGKSPAGLQAFIEPIFVFIQDEVCKPFLGHKWERFQPFIMSLFFFILALNLVGQIPFLGGANVTGNLAVTMVLALLTFIVTNINGNAHYWMHILWPPGVPFYVKLILVPVEIMGIFIKPMTLMLRLFANITAGHIVILVFAGLIFIFGKSGESLGGSLGAAVGSMLLSLFMMAIELIVAFVQAFVFAILTASYIGAATEEEHH
jgi:F-type H+-transporting ATPase subunit a